MMKSTLVTFLVLVASFVFASNIPAKKGSKVPAKEEIPNQYSLTVYNYGSGKEYFVQLSVNLTNGTALKSKYIGFKDYDVVVFPSEQYKAGSVYKFREKPTNITQLSDEELSNANVNVTGLNSEKSSNAPHLIEQHSFPMMVTIGRNDNNQTILRFCYNVTGTYDYSRIDSIPCPQLKSTPAKIIKFQPSTIDPLL